MLTLLACGQSQNGTYVELMLQAYKLRVYAEAGVFEAEECLKASLKTLDDYQVDPDAQLVRNYATRVRANGGTVESFESTITSIKTLNNSDLHDKASLSLFPSGFKNGTIFSLQPESIIGNDLIVNGNFLQNETNWTKTEPINSSVTFTNNQLTFNRGSNSSDPSVRNIGIGIKGKTYKITFEVVSATVLSNNVGVSIGGNTVYLVPSISSVGIKEIIITATETSSITIQHGGGGPSIIVLDNISAKEYSSADFSFNRSSTSSRTNRFGLIETAAIDIPTLNYPILGNAPELLLEPQSTNKLVNSVLANSGGFPTNYGGANTGTATPIVSIKNTNVNAYSFDSTNGRVFFSQGQIFNIGESTLYSVYIESVTTAIEVQHLINSTGGTITYYKDNTAITGTTLITAGSTFSTACISTITNGEMRFGIINSGVVGIFTLSMPQFENGTFATSFIPTTTSAVTRVSPRDIIVNGLDTKGITLATQGTIFLKLGLVDNASSAVLINLSTTNIQDRVAILVNAGNIRMLVSLNGVTTVNYTQSGISANNSNVAVTYLNGVYKLFINGAIRFTSSQITQFSYTSVQLTDQNGGGIIGSSRSIKSLQLFKTALTDAECITLTS
jgi:hypothetical protein